jgi:hypothetical protein
MRRPVCYACRLNPGLRYREKDEDGHWYYYYQVCRFCQSKVDKAIKEILEKIIATA